jgi:hypothetical protein
LKNLPQKTKPRKNSGLIILNYAHAFLNIFSHPDFTVGFGISDFSDHQISRICGSRTLPPVGNSFVVTLPRRTFYILLKVSYNSIAYLSTEIILVDKP